MPGVTVDIDQPELLAKQVKRFDLLSTVADELYEGPTRLLNPAEVVFSQGDLLSATRGYFLLSEAYKRSRLGHTDADQKRTKNPKKAALTSLAVFKFRPFRLARPLQAPLSTISRVANLHFSLDFATTVLGIFPA